MVKPDALLLLLAVLSQRESNAQLIETTDCPITYFGETYEKIDVISEASSFKFCFKNSSSEADHNCVEFEGAQDINDIPDLKETACYGPGSFVHSVLPDLGSTSDCQRKILFFNSDDAIFFKALFFNFKKEAVMKITAYEEYAGTNITMKFTAGNSLLGSLSLTKAQTRSRGGGYINLSGCRLTEAPFAIRTGEQHNSTTGTSYNCNPSQDFSSQVVMNFSCTYSESENQNPYYTIPHSSVVQQVVSGDLKYTVTMNAYNDRGRKNLVQSTSLIKLNQTIWVEIKSEELKGEWIVLVTKSCWATDGQSPDKGARYDLIINGCPNPVDQTVTVEGNGLGTTNVFSFNMFQFSRRNSKIYLHCRLELCPKQLNSCAPVCS